MEQGLRPGDRVVDLATLVRTAGAASGALTGLLVAWLTGVGSLASLALVAAAVIGGGGVGHALGLLRFVAQDRRSVVQQGAAGSRAAIDACLSASVPVAVLGWLGGALAVGPYASPLAAGALCLLSGLLVGVCLAVLATR
jgi:hypothetical protein